MSSLCKWCNTLTDEIVKVFQSKTLVWVGCQDCNKKRKERLKNAEKN